MAPSKRNYGDTIEALKDIIKESLQNPERKQEFVDEGSVELIIGLCDKRTIPWSLGAYCAAALRVLAYGNPKVKAKIVGRGGIPPLLKLCDPELSPEDTDTTEDACWRFLAHEQAVAVLRLVTFQSKTCQTEVVSAGAIKLLVRMCDIFNPEGFHGNCCQPPYWSSSDAVQLLHDLTYRKKLVGQLKELNQDNIREKAVKLIKTGLVSGVIQVNRMYSIDLYDTTMDYQDIRITDELIKSQLMWPRMSLDETKSSKDKGKYVNAKDADGRWADIYVTQVIDACHFWAHVGGKPVIEKMEAVNRKLLAQEQIPLDAIPKPGTYVCVTEIVAGHWNSYRAQVLLADDSTDSSATVQVFAIDNGFTGTVSANCLYVLPEELLKIPPQATLCCLSGIQLPPKSAEVLEHTAGTLRNLTEDDNSNRLYIAAQEGLEYLIKLCTVPNRDVCIQAVGALLNLAINSKVQVRIGFLGGIQALLDVCQRFLQDEEILLLAVGAIQNLVRDSYVNRCRLADSDGLIVLSRIYRASESEAIKTKCLHALRNLVGRYITSLEDCDLKVTKTFRDLDPRSIVDEGKKFSLAVSDDGGSRYRRPRRRRRRLRRGEVESKPTPVALSPDNIRRSSSGESKGVSDYDISNSYEDTDGDTDGEKLVTSEQVTSSSDNTDVDKEKYYIQGYHVSFSEDDLHDIRPQTNVNNVSIKPVTRSLCAFLNSGKCGTVYLGIRKDGIVAGLKINKKQRDQLRLGVDDIMDHFHPSVKHHSYQVDFVPVVRQRGSEKLSSRVQVEDRFVVEIKIVNCPGLTYTTPNGKCFFRQKNRNEEYTTQEVRERTIKEQEDLYNSEMQSLRMELDEMKKKLSEKSGVTDDTPLNSHHQDTGLTSQHKGGTVSLNGCKRTSRIRGSVENSSDAPKESTQEELQAANCVIA
ncbi:unnamed protein product [Pocillopora meandrina]|uniref:Schlafen AlbA-2 domain-containing protein n=1 Tax=Pocillopora meandrina TaxID=46732 RepID=A0AAU9XMA1_9CNID|nr:unnamed protein product [Pocillopora meandrina]